MSHAQVLLSLEVQQQQLSQEQIGCGTSLLRQHFCLSQVSLYHIVVPLLPLSCQLVLFQSQPLSVCASCMMWCGALVLELSRSLFLCWLTGVALQTPCSSVCGQGL